MKLRRRIQIHKVGASLSLFCVEAVSMREARVDISAHLKGDFGNTGTMEIGEVYAK